MSRQLRPALVCLGVATLLLGIVYPLLDAATDGEAQRMLEEIFPEHKVVGVPAREILLGGGNIHCITQQIPSGQ